MNVGDVCGGPGAGLGWRRIVGLFGVTIGQWRVVVGARGRLARAASLCLGLGRLSDSALSEDLREDGDDGFHDGVCVDLGRRLLLFSLAACCRRCSWPWMVGFTDADT